MAIMDAPESLSGVETLEALGLAPDPETGELKPITPYGVLLFSPKSGDSSRQLAVGRFTQPQGTRNAKCYKAHLPHS